MHMNCKFCHAEMEDGNPICPACGKDNDAVEVAPVEQEPEISTAQETETAQETPAAEPEQTGAVCEPAEEDFPAQEKKKPSAGKLALLIALGVVVLAAVVALVIATIHMGRNNVQPDSTDPTDTSTSAADASEATVPTDGNPDDVTCKGSYTVSDDALAAVRDTVVATVGEESLTVGQLQIYYWRSFYDFMNNYGNYASYFGLDYTQPLDTQTCSITGGTWQQYFLSSALSDWHRYLSLSMEAEKAGMHLSDEQQDYLDNLESTLSSTAESYNFDNYLDMIRSDLGPTATLEDYAYYVRLSYMGYLFYSSEFEKLNPSESDVETYFDEHAEDFEADGVTKETGNYVNVRHILIEPEDGTTDENGNKTYTDEAWEACRIKAQGLLDSWLAGAKTEESFAELAKENTADTASKETGGLYEKVVEGRMVTEFNDWCFDESRQPGDYGLVKTKYGYHIMYFVDSQAIWYTNAYEALMSSLSNDIIDQAITAHPIEVDYSSIVLGYVKQGSES